MTRAGYAFIAVFLIVVFEGAVRKWVASSATLPLILVRDLLAIYLIFHALEATGTCGANKASPRRLLAWSCLRHRMGPAATHRRRELSHRSC